MEFLRLVSSAKRGGGDNALYPRGDPARAPWFLVVAVSHALTILGYAELPEDSRPPEEIWLDDEALGEHFDSVRARLKESSSGGWEAVPGATEEQNEITRAFKR